MSKTDIDLLRTQPVSPAAHIIDGTRRAASDGATMDVISPIEGQRLTTMPRGTRDDAEAAIAAARRAFDDERWPALAPLRARRHC